MITIVTQTNFTTFIPSLKKHGHTRIWKKKGVAIHASSRPHGPKLEDQGGLVVSNITQVVPNSSTAPTKSKNCKGTYRIQGGDSMLRRCCICREPTSCPPVFINLFVEMLKTHQIECYVISPMCFSDFLLPI